MVIRDVAGIITAVIVLAGITVSLRYGSETARVFDSASSGLSNVIKAATAQG